MTESGFGEGSVQELVFDDMSGGEGYRGHIEEKRVRKVEEWLNERYDFGAPFVQSFADMDVKDKTFKDIQELCSSEKCGDDDNWSRHSFSTKTVEENYFIEEEFNDLKDADFHGFCVEDIVKLRLVLKRNVLGMTLDEYQDLYQIKYGYPLHSYSFKSIMEMIHSMNKLFFLEGIHSDDIRLTKEDIFRDFLIHDARLQALPIVQNLAERRPKPKPNTISEDQQIYWFNTIAESVSSVDVYKCRVDFRDMGFGSKLEFFEGLSELIPIRISNLHKLYFRPMSAIKTFISQLMSNGNYDYIQQINYPDIPVLKPGNEIPVPLIGQLFEQLNGQIRPVYISSVVSYKKFFGVLIEEKFFSLWKDMEDFYISDEQNVYEVPEMFLVSGLVCAALCPENGWIRTQIIEIESQITNSEETENQTTPQIKHIKLKALDFGYHLKVETKDLKLLHKAFGQLYVQSIELRLNGVKKVKKSILKESLFKFRTKRPETPEDELFCQFVALHDQSIEVIVFETDDLSEYYSIGQHLIDQKMIKKTDKYVAPDWDLLFSAVQYYYQNDD